jgi:hypothetical protein
MLIQEINFIKFYKLIWFIFIYKADSKIIKLL